MLIAIPVAFKRHKHLSVVHAENGNFRDELFVVFFGFKKNKNTQVFFNLNYSFGPMNLKNIICQFYVRSVQHRFAIDKIRQVMIFCNDKF